jgi:hypothetical protein
LNRLFRAWWRRYCRAVQIDTEMEIGNYEQVLRKLSLFSRASVMERSSMA